MDHTQQQPDGVIFNLRDLAKDGEAGLLGTINIMGVPHHVHLIEVHVVDDLQTPVADPYDRYGDLQHCYEGCYATVQVPGHDGKEYVVQVLPYAD